MLDFFESEKLSKVDLFGFSLGGKVAMQTSLNKLTSNYINKLIVGDVSPIKYQTSIMGIKNIMNILVDIVRIFKFLISLGFIKN